MRKRFAFALLASIIAATLFSVQPSHALAANVTISQVQLGDATSASNEFIELYNNSLTDVEITNWCVYYASAASTENGSKLACFVPESDNLHLYLPSHSFVFAISTSLAATMPSLGSDAKFSATLSATAGHVRLIDSAGGEVDKVGWGVAAVSAEGASPAGAPPIGKVLQRKTSSLNILQDSDVNSADFESVPPREAYSYGSIYEVQDLCSNIIGIQTAVPAGYSADSAGNCMPPPVDVCLNLDGLQVSVPAGYAYDVGGNCLVDICQNIDGLQVILPDGLEFDDAGNCVAHDECSNVPGIQATMPAGYKRGINNDCVLDLVPLRITELLPNASGSDTGNEFIEIYNPTNQDVDLGQYVLVVGTGSAKSFSFPADARVGLGQYVVFSNADIAFTLLNTSGGVRLTGIDGSFVDETPMYSDPGDDMAWALIDGIWDYTNRPTPGSTNVGSLVEDDNETTTTSSLKACALNQYRSLETNRCRLLSTAGSVLAPCKDGQYRSEQTNRCRSIATDAGGLVACKDNQERNLDTNRCRLIASVGTTLVECKAGQERNPETNRCRNTVKILSAAFPVEAVAVSSDSYLGWLALGGIGVGAVGYGVWEWRVEIAQVLRKFRSFARSKK